MESYGDPNDFPDVPPICQTLYTRLKAIASDNQVIIANQGEYMTGDNLPDASRPGTLRWTVVTWGETYRINCPYCNDDRHRLWVNYMFGQLDPADMTKAADFYGICFNEDCLQEPGNRQLLFNEIFGVSNAANRRHQAPSLTPQNAAKSSAKLIPRDFPGPAISLRNVPIESPMMQYFLGERRFYEQTIDDYGLVTCTTTHDRRHALAAGRIIAPVIQHGVQYGWQGRYVGKPPNKHVPKYFTCPDMPKRFLLYNHDQAVDKPFVVVFEGITDVWRLGDWSVSVLGKTLSPQQRLLLQTSWPGKPIIICFDSDAWDNSMQAIQLLINGVNPVIRVRMPEGWDPADFDRDPLRQLIVTEAREAGLHISF